MGKLYLGFDAGTQSVKVAVYDSSWTKVASHSLPTTLGYPNPGWVQMDADEYVANTVTCMKACSEELRRKGYNPADVAAIMGDGIICGITGIDADGNAITPFINYLDSRTKEDVDAINSTPREIWGRETGKPGSFLYVSGDVRPLVPEEFRRVQRTRREVCP